MSTPTSDDPVAAKSLFLTTYMSNHVDTLVAYILHHLQQELEHAPQSRPAGSASSKGKKREADGRSTTSTTPTATEVKSPKMLKIDSREMAIQYTDGSDGDKVKKVGGGVGLEHEEEEEEAGKGCPCDRDASQSMPVLAMHRSKQASKQARRPSLQPVVPLPCRSQIPCSIFQVIIPFDPPLLGYEEVRPRLLDMKLQAENAVGMVSEQVMLRSTAELHLSFGARSLRPLAILHASLCSWMSCPHSRSPPL